MRMQTLTQLVSRLQSRGEAAFPTSSRWLVREPSPWQPPEANARMTMPIIPASALLAGSEALVVELQPSPSNAPITLGRAETNDVVINDGTLSKLHLHFNPNSVGWEVEDVGSYNGTVLDGVKLVANLTRPLRDGVLLRAGTVEMSFHDTPGLLVRLRTTAGRPRGTSSSPPR